MKRVLLTGGSVGRELVSRLSAADYSVRLTTRATDAAGNTQPIHQPNNQEGYLLNMVYPHPVKEVAR